MATERTASSALDRWGRDLAQNAPLPLFESAYRSWFRMEWAGLENVPPDGGALLVSNHAGMMPVDGGIIQHGIQEESSRLVYLLAHHGFFQFPFVGRTLNRIGTVVGHPDNAHRLLREDGRLVLVFPEGEKGPVKPRGERYRLQRSLDLAKEVQQNLLPRKDPVVKGLDVAGQSIYCDETGGDYFDYLSSSELGPAKFGVLIGDVSGHGISSALLMATARAFMRQRSSKSGSS